MMRQTEAYMSAYWYMEWRAGLIWRVIHIFMDYLRMRMLRLSCTIKQIRLSHGRQWEECMINI